MSKDTLNQTWIKTLSSVVTAVAPDSSGSVWVGDMSGKLTKFTSEGVASEPIQLDNPIMSISVDTKTKDVYVGDSANNIFKYSNFGELKWGKNLGEGSTAKVPLVSTINGKEPDENSNIDLSSTYYSQQQMDKLLAPLGKTKTVNGNIPDSAGNITLDLSSYYAYNGVIDDGTNLDKLQTTGWYSKHESTGGNGILLVYSADGSNTQISVGYDKSIKIRTKNSGKFTDWYTVTDNIRTINHLKPDSTGNIDLDLTGNIKSVNNIKPDKNGNIQLGVGSKNSVKSINTVNKPDETGNVTVPTFSPNLLLNTTNKKQIIQPNTDKQSTNLLLSDNISTDSGLDARGADGNSYKDGEAITGDIAIHSGESYTYNLDVSTVPTMLEANIYSAYSQWRKATAEIYLRFKDANGNIISVARQSVYKQFQQKSTPEMFNISDTFTAPPKATTVQLMYFGLQKTSDNLAVFEIGNPYPYSCAQHTNSLDQIVDFPKMALAKDLSGKRIVLKIQANVTNYKKGNFITVKTKDLTDKIFKLDVDKLDDTKKLSRPLTAIDLDNIVDRNGFYEWEYVLNGDDLIGVTDKTITPVTNIIGNIDYTIKISTWEDGDKYPDMEWSSAPATKVDGSIDMYYGASYNKLNFCRGKLYSNNKCNIISLGNYKFNNEYISLNETLGRYSASTYMDMQSSGGYAKLVLVLQDGAGSSLLQAESDILPKYYVDDSGRVNTINQGILEANSITNNVLDENASINVYLYIYGQNDNIEVSQTKLAKWKNDGQTPPDLTWLPNVVDTLGGTQSVNNIKPDKSGNIDLVPFLNQLPLANPDNARSIYSGAVNIDTITDPGVYKLNNVILNSSAILPNEYDKKHTYSGWLCNFEAPSLIYQVIFVYRQSTDKYDGVGTYYRVLLKSNISASVPLRHLSTTDDVLNYINDNTYSKTYTDSNFLAKTDAESKYAKKTDLSSLIASTASGAKVNYRNTTINPDTITDTGIYRLEATEISAYINDVKIYGKQWGWLIVNNYDNNSTTNALYQVLIVNNRLSYRICSLQNNIYTSFKTYIKSINNRLPDDWGNLKLPNIYNPDFIIKTATFDVDTVTKEGIYSIQGSEIIASKGSYHLTDIPSSSRLTANGYLVQINYSDYYNMQFLFLNNTPIDIDIVIAYRCIGSGGSSYADSFKRVLSSADLRDLTTTVNQLSNKIDAVSAAQANFMKSWSGTLAEYQALSSHDQNTIYYILSGYKVVKK